MHSDWGTHVSHSLPSGILSISPIEGTGPWSPPPPHTQAVLKWQILFKLSELDRQASQVGPYRDLTQNSKVRTVLWERDLGRCLENEKKTLKRMKQFI